MNGLINWMYSTTCSILFWSGVDLGDFILKSVTQWLHFSNQQREGVPPERTEQSRLVVRDPANYSRRVSCSALVLVCRCTARNALHAAVPASLLCSLLPLSRGHAASYPVLFLLSGPYCILRLAQCAVPHRYVCWLAAQPLVLLGCVVNLCLSLSLGVSSYTQFVMFWALSE